MRVYLLPSFRAFEVMAAGLTSTLVHQIQLSLSLSSVGEKGWARARSFQPIRDEIDYYWRTKVTSHESEEDDGIRSFALLR
jgi:hypothetical protein